ncbi:MAG: biotin-dependent carboxyltransferase family protein [Chthoniobacterales bacterium]
MIAPGCGATWQDAGRPGWKRFGVPPGAWMDATAARSANRLLGNAEDAVVLELALQGARFLVVADGWLAVAGASMGWPPGTARQVRRGEELSFTRHRGGVYAYLAAPGGWVAPQILGSASVSARSGLGRPLAKGDVLSCHHHPASPDAPRGGEAQPAAAYPLHLEINVWRGPQWREFSEAARRIFFGTRWTVSAQLDRMGVRLTGATIATPPATMPSEPVLPGSVQITGGGEPVVTMRDGPTVGGYPKIAWLDEEACRRVAQIPPGGTVAFLPPLE